MRIDEQPRTRWPDTSAFRARRPDLRLGSRRQRIDPAGAAEGRIAVQHTVRTPTAEYTLLLNAPEWLGRRGVGDALRDSVAELRAVDLTYGPNRPESLTSMLRRGEISPDSYPPLADLVDRCTAMRAATDGWFDAWAVPGGFDPGGLLGGWAVERAAPGCAPRASTTTPCSRAPTWSYAATHRTAGRGGWRCTIRPRRNAHHWCWR
ncbi:hypothetical protein GCM10027614_64820 [Micromonospora vulcania]